MALDPEHYRAFLACVGNELMTVFDLDKHAPIAFLPLPGGPDVIKFDPDLGRIYVACCSGFISVFHADDADHYRKLEDFHVQHAVHSLTVDLQTHRVYSPNRWQGWSSLKPWSPALDEKEDQLLLFRDREQ